MFGLSLSRWNRSMPKICAALSHELQSQIGTEAMDLKARVCIYRAEKACGERRVIQGKFDNGESSESIGFSHCQFGLVVQAFDDAAGELLFGSEIVED